MAGVAGVAYGWGGWGSVWLGWLAWYNFRSKLNYLTTCSSLSARAKIWRCIFTLAVEDLGSSRRRSRHNQLAVVEPLHIKEGRDEV